jgi:hypothetical protein
MAAALAQCRAVRPSVELGVMVVDRDHGTARLIPLATQSASFGFRVKLIGAVGSTCHRSKQTLTACRVTVVSAPP